MLHRSRGFVPDRKGRRPPIFGVFHRRWVQFPYCDGAMHIVNTGFRGVVLEGLEGLRALWCVVAAAVPVPAPVTCGKGGIGAGVRGTPSAGSGCVDRAPLPGSAHATCGTYLSLCPPFSAWEARWEDPRWGQGLTGPSPDRSTAAGPSFDRCATLAHNCASSPERCPSG